MLSCRRAMKTVQDPDADDKIRMSLDAQDEQARKVVKLLLLGAGESGKSTLFKQMKVINQDGYSDEEREIFKPIVRANLRETMDVVVQQLHTTLELDKLLDLKRAVQTYQEIVASGCEMTPRFAACMHSLLSFNQVQYIIDHWAEHHLNDSAAYYFDAIDRICQEDYLPTTMDVLRARVRTTGIVQTRFTIANTEFAMLDVGGQRAERRKWIHSFDDVNAVCFVAAMSEFDQVLFDDTTTNRLDEALDLFKQVCRSKWFKGIPIMLFLNKMDLFEKKILSGKKLSDYRPEYMGENTVDECAQFISELFLGQVSSPNDVYVLKTTATDTENVKFVFDSVVEIVLESNLVQAGL